MLKLICEEWVEVTKEILREDTNKPIQYFVEGPTIQSNKPNRNKRIYPEEYVDREVKLYVEERMNKNRAFGEFGHPDNAKINEERISHRFTSIKKSGSDYISRAIINPEGLGKIVRGIIDIDGTLGMSSRAVGTMKEDANGIGVVQSNLHLITPGDIVVEPSAQIAFIRGIKEGVEYEFGEDGILIEHVIDHVDKNYKMLMSIEEKQKVLIEGFQKMVEGMRRKN